MALPNANQGTDKIIKYAAEVGGRCLGVAACPELIPVEATRVALTEKGNRIIEGVRRLGASWVATLLHEYLEHRINVGRGYGLDRGWDRTVIKVSEGAKSVLPDRNTADPAYRTVFEDGTVSNYTKPSIKQDDGLAAELRTKVVASGLSNRDALAALIDGILPLIEEGARAVRDGEGHTNELFKTEVNIRTELTDLLWSERKNTEALLGRTGRSLVGLIFFDFRTSSSATTPGGAAPAETTTPTGIVEPEETPA